MLSINNGLVVLIEKCMRSFLINKNLCLYYRLKKRIGKNWALMVKESGGSFREKMAELPKDGPEVDSVFLFGLLAF